MTKAKEFDRQFDSGVDVTGHLDYDQTGRPNQALQELTIELPNWVVDALDRQAHQRDMSRDLLIRLWLAERLKKMR